MTLDLARDRVTFLREHVGEVYDRLTGGMTRPLRVRELAYAAAAEYPGLVPTWEEVRPERELGRQSAKLERGGHAEIAQGDFLAHVLAQPAAGRHLMHAMQQPLPESLERLDGLRRTGCADLGPVRVDRRDNVGHVTIQNHRYLNSEDNESNRALEMAVDLVLLDPEVEVATLRGGPAEHPKHLGRRIFGSGINLTHLYHGRIGFIEFLVERELGLNNKMYRGLSPDGFRLTDLEEGSEKPFIAVVDSWAIGGACQWLLVMDHVIAERGSYLSLPARKEGIIPGLANLRMVRFAGDRLTRQAIFFNREFAADSPEGRLLCDTVVDADELDSALASACAQITSAGITSLTANRRMVRLGEEPRDVFRAYMAMYCREQARCLYSPGLISNLERNWNARERRLKD
jgi:(3,5-dihydroxyphenyl)acetyl-CoA 1,2-dioxygenase